jgi:anaphase-promoting complex subunit 4
MLLQVAEQLLPVRLKAGLLSYCPTMDLVAVATEDEQVQVFRLNGQKVFTVPKRKDDAVVTSLCWRPNGMTLQNVEAP